MNNINWDNITKHRPRIFNCLMKKFRISHDLIEDAIQHSFIKIMKFQQPIRNIINLILKIASNYLSDIKKSSFWKSKFQDCLRIECQSPRISNETCETLFRIDALDLEFLLDYTEKKNLEKWAETFKIKVGSLSMRWSRLVKKYQIKFGV